MASHCSLPGDAQTEWQSTDTHRFPDDKWINGAQSDKERDDNRVF